MRLKLSLPILLIAAMAHAQVWEKPIAPGLTYRMEFDASVPRITHALRFSQGTPAVRASAELAGGNVYADDVTKGRETISQMVARTGALAGINADFFPFTGQPLGVMLRHNELISVPGIPRAVFGWGDKDSAFGFITFAGAITADGAQPIAIDGLNGECPPDSVNIDTQTAGLALSKGPATYVVLEMDDQNWKPNGTNSGTILTITQDQTKQPVGQGQTVIVASGIKRTLLSNLRQGDHLSFNFRTTGMPWDRIHDTVGGGPFLVRNGQVAVDAVQEKFDEKFYAKRHPRSAVGRTAVGDIWFVAVDGRSKISDGATLEEMAGIMKKLGCVDAMNLDGGGSTTLNILGLTVNRPSDGKERPVANGVLFYGSRPDPAEENLTLRSPDTLELGVATTLAVTDAKGATVPDSEILWSSSGASGWVDQGGLIHPGVLGPLTVFAAVHGRFLSKQITVVEPPKRPVTKANRSKVGRKKKKPLARPVASVLRGPAR